MELKKAAMKPRNLKPAAIQFHQNPLMMAGFWLKLNAGWPGYVWIERSINSFISWIKPNQIHATKAVFDLDLMKWNELMALNQTYLAFLLLSQFIHQLS